MKPRWIMIPLSVAATAAVLLSACSSANYAGSASSTAAYKEISQTAPAVMAPMPGDGNGMTAGALEEVAVADDMAMSKEATAVYENMLMEESGIDTAATDTGAGSAAGAQQQNRKLIKYSNLDLQTKEFDKAVADLTALVEQAGGYIESQSIAGNDIRALESGYSERHASINARIPADKLDETISAVGGVCHVISHNQRMEDISETYFDADARLKSLNQQETQLLDILSKSEKLEDVVSLQQALGDVRYQIESITASLRRMDSQVSYSYLGMELHEVVDYQTIQETPKTFGEQFAAALGRSGVRIGNTTRYGLLSIVEYGPSFLLQAAWVIFCWWVVIWLIRLILRRFGINNRFTRKWQRKKNSKTATALTSADTVSSDDTPPSDDTPFNQN